MTTTAAHWATVERQKARMWAHRQHSENEREQALGEIARTVDRRARDAITSTMRDRDICQLAERRAEAVRKALTARSEQAGAYAFAVWLSDLVESLNGRPLKWIGRRQQHAPCPSSLEGLVSRSTCPLWWRRQLRRAVVALREAEGVRAGQVCAVRRQPYVTNDTLARRIEKLARDRALLEATEIESEAGDVITLAQAADASVANKAIRRGELMTRIRGCEELADAFGMVGLFTTNTAPSRFHSTLLHGGPNPKWHGAYGPVQPNMPRDAQRWLCRTWARTRAELHRKRLAVFGFRVAEPHHDGCPHWHMLIWTFPDQVQAVEAVLRKHWLAENGDEQGASEHRFKCKAMEQGGATGYVAKYIAKGIDDAGTVGGEGHQDHDWESGEAVPMPRQGDMFGGPAQRVEAWAAAHGIRQFQAIGQPPVTVWRELRRIKDVAGATDRVQEAWRAAHRHGLIAADWAAYVKAQGGVMQGRKHAIRVVGLVEERAGRYEMTTQLRPVGVEDMDRPGEWVLSERRQWKPKGTWRRDEQQAAKPRAAWTRFNNCTRVAGVELAGRAPLRTWLEQVEFQQASNEHRAEISALWKERLSRARPSALAPTQHHRPTGAEQRACSEAAPRVVPPVVNAGVIRCGSDRKGSAGQAEHDGREAGK